MNEPDFDQIARTSLGLTNPWGDAGSLVTIEAVAEQLRLVWNARGAADVVKLEQVRAEEGASWNVPDRAIRSLDR